MKGIRCNSFCLAQCGLSKEWFVFVQPVAPLPYLHSSFWTRGCYQRPWMKQLPSTLHHSPVQVLPRLWKCCVLPVVSDTLLANGSWLWSNLIPQSELGFGCFRGPLTTGGLYLDHASQLPASAGELFSSGRGIWKVSPTLVDCSERGWLAPATSRTLILSDERVSARPCGQAVPDFSLHKPAEAH